MAPRKRASSDDTGASAPAVVDLAAMSRAIAKATGTEVLVAEELEPTSFLSTGLPLVDLVFGGGLPQARISHVWGDSSTGKSLLAMWVAAYQQSIDPEMLVIYGDTERALERAFAQKIGLDLKRVVLGHPDTVEEAFSFYASAIDAASKLVDPAKTLVVWDSVASTMSAQEQKAGYEGQQPARLAAAMSAGLKQFRPCIHKSGVTMLMINQCRKKVGISYGAKDGPCGGNAVIFYSDLSFRLTQQAVFKENKEADPYGVRVRLRADKCRVGIPARQGWFDLFWGTGQVTDLPAYYDALKKYKLAGSAGGGKIIVKDGVGPEGGKTLFSGKNDLINRLAADVPYKMLLVSLLRDAMTPANVIIGDIPSVDVDEDGAEVVTTEEDDEPLADFSD